MTALIRQGDLFLDSSYRQTEQFTSCVHYRAKLE